MRPALIASLLVGAAGRVIPDRSGSIFPWMTTSFAADWAPTKAEQLENAGEAGGNFDHYGKLLQRAQRKVERNHFRDRMVLLHHEKERKKVQGEMGQDPYLDSPD